MAMTGQRVGADDPPAAGPNIEPIDFAANAVAQREAPGPNSPMAGSGAWGFATFSPDSKSLATIAQFDADSQKGDVIVWDVEGVKMKCQFQHPGRIAAAAFSPDGKRLAMGPAGPQFGVTIVDAATGEVALTLPGPAARTNCIAWSTDGKRLALGSTFDKSVREWDVAKKRFVKAHEVSLKHVFAIGFNTDGKLIAIGPAPAEPTVLHVLDTQTGKPLHVLTGHKETVEGAELSLDASRIVSAGWDATVRIWDATTGQSIGELKGHKRGISTVSQSFDGKRVASASTREFKLWDGEKKESLADLGGENGNAKQVAMSPSGAWLVSISRDGAGHLWDVEKQSEKTTLDRNPQATETTEEPADDPKPAAPPPSDAPEPEAIQSLAYSKDGRWLAIAREDGRISIRTAVDGKAHREIEAFGDVAASVAFSPDSQLVASGSFDKVIKVWKVESGEQVAELTGHGNWVFGVKFSPDSRTLASASYDKTVKLWNIAEAKEIATLSGHTAGVRAVAFTHDGKYLISGGSDRTAIVWNIETQKAEKTLKGHAAAIRDIACSPDGGTVATASEDATIKLWKTDDWSERAVARGADGVMFWCLAYSPQGRTLAGGAFDGSVKLFDPSDGKERTTLRGPTDAITAIAFAPDAHEIIAGSIDKTYRRWQAQKAATITTPSGDTKAPELKSGEAVTALNAVTLKAEQPICSLAFDKPGKLLAVGTGAYRVAGSLQLWDVVKHEKKWQSAYFKFGLPAVAFSSNGQQLASGNFADNFLRIYNTADGEKLKELRGHRSKVHAVAYSPNGKTFATASLDRDVKLWDAATNREIKTFVGHKDFVLSIAFSPDGTQLLSASADRTARLWNVESGQQIYELLGHGGLIQQAAFSYDGTRVATAGADGVGRVYDTATGDYLFTLRGHRNKLESVAFSPNGKLIATGSIDRTIRLWDASCGAEMLKLTQDMGLRTVLFSPDGKLLASGSDDKTVKLWDVAAFGSR
jgi:WD40 repeat protein